MATAKESIDFINTRTPIQVVEQMMWTLKNSVPKDISIDMNLCHMSCGQGGTGLDSFDNYITLHSGIIFEWQLYLQKILAELKKNDNR